MKKIFITLVAVIAIAQFSYAQVWHRSASDTTNIYNLNSGKVGIGTDSPSGKLHVKGGGEIIEQTGATTLLTLRDATYTGDQYLTFSQNAPDYTISAGYGLNLKAANASNNPAYPLTFWTAGTERLRISTNGNVGIGTTSPGAKLQINSPAGAAYAPVLSFTEGGNPTYGFSFLQDDLTTGDLQLNRVNAGTSMQMMTFQRNTGNVGVGTTTPFTTLTIPSSTNAKYIGWDYNSGSSGSRRWWFGNDQIEYGDFSFATESTQGRSAPDLTRLYIKANGNVGIGTTSSDEKLTVKGKIHAEEVKIDLSVPAPDYVFENGYKLPALNYLKSYVDKNHHLPETPSAKEMARDGLNLGEMNTLLLKKVEELTLYLIEQDKHIKAIEKQLPKANKRK